MLLIFLIVVLLAVGGLICFILKEIKKEEQKEQVKPTLSAVLTPSVNASSPTQAQAIVSDPNAKKWPVLAQIFIALGCFGGIRGLVEIISAVQHFNIYYMLEGVLSVLSGVILWNVYKFKRWALMGLNILFSLGICIALYSILLKAPIIPCIMIIAIRILFILYFNSPEIKALFG